MLIQSNIKTEFSTHQTQQIHQGTKCYMAMHSQNGDSTSTQAAILSTG